MSQVHKMVLKPREKLVTRLFLSPNIRQQLGVLSYSSHDLINVLKDLADSNPFVSLKQAKGDFQNLDWIEDTNQENLIDHLLEQIHLSSWNKKIQEQVTYLVYHLDNDGYLRIDLTKLANTSQFTEAELKEGKHYLNKLDPLGIGGFDLNDCLLIQAREKQDFNHLALDVLEKHQLELLADPIHWNEINENEEEIKKALDAIQTLNPNPAQDYKTGETIQYLIPDLKFSIEEKKIYVTTAFDQIPELIFDEDSFEEMKSQVGKENMDFLNKQKREYLDLQEAVRQRQRTLLRLGKIVGNYQNTFLKSMDSKDLKPLGLKEIASQLALAPSTISRAIKEKYVECQNQIFSLKMLFPREVKDNCSQVFLEERLKDLIKQEDKKSPLSDAMLVDILSKQDLKLSRRVIAKYRKRLGIPNSYERREK